MKVKKITINVRTCKMLRAYAADGTEKLTQTEVLKT